MCSAGILVKKKDNRPLAMWVDGKIASLLFRAVRYGM